MKTNANFKLPREIKRMLILMSKNKADYITSKHIFIDAVDTEMRNKMRTRKSSDGDKT